MGAGLRRRIALASAILTFAFGLPATGEEYIACWREAQYDPIALRFHPITRCRLAGGEIVEFTSDNEVPTQLYPAMGSVDGTACWYYTSRPNTLWVIIYVYPSGEADIAVQSADSTPVAVGLYMRCSSEPEEIDPIAEIWEYVLSYTHPPPVPDLDPAPGFGVTGLETFMGVAIPEPHEAVLSAGGLALQLEIEVSQVIVHWGDGTITSHPADGPALVAGPDGPAFHLYEQKLPDAQLVVAYSWDVRWRTVGAGWRGLTVPDTLTTVAYPVSEIVAVLGG